MRGPQCRPQNTIVLIVGTPKKVPIILGNPHMVNLKVLLHNHLTGPILQLSLGLGLEWCIHALHSEALNPRILEVKMLERQPENPAWAYL